MGKSLPEDIKKGLLEKGFITTRSNHAKFIMSSKNGRVVAYISAYTGSNEAIYKIGSTTYFDNFNECSVWVEADKKTVYTVTYASTSDPESSDYPLKNDLNTAADRAAALVKAEDTSSVN